MNQKPDYLAIVFFEAGTSHGRASTQLEAVELAKANVESDWGSIYRFEPDTLLTACVFDVTGRENIIWGHDGVFIVVDDENCEKIPWTDATTVTFKVPKRMEKKRKSA